MPFWQADNDTNLNDCDNHTGKQLLQDVQYLVAGVIKLLIYNYIGQ